MNIWRSVLSLFTLSYALKASVQDLLSRFDTLVQEHATVSGIDLRGRYTLDYSVSRGKCKKYPDQIHWWHTRYGLILCALIGSEKVPIAILGFERGLRHLTVHRLRRMSGAAEHLDYLHWERLLYISLIEVCAGLTIFKRLCVCPPGISFFSPHANPDFGVDLNLAQLNACEEDLQVQHVQIPAELGFKPKGPLRTLERCL